MSKKERNQSSGTNNELVISEPLKCDFVGCAHVDEYAVRNLEGILLTLIDSLGFENQPTREKAVKDMVRHQLWGWSKPFFEESYKLHRVRPAGPQGE